MKERLYIVILVCVFSVVLCAQNKHALLIGLSQYPNVSGKSAKWTDIHGANDVQVLSNTLKRHGFAIITLLDENATANNIRLQINELSKRVHNGDMVYLHFSGHGQPVEDMDGDEKDGWDEAIVPYDAEMFYQKGVYEGKNHILDDELGRDIDKLSTVLGKFGKLLVVIDACHSGTSFRDDEQPEEIAPTRGTNLGFSETKFYRPSRVDQPILYHVNNGCKVIVLEACQPTQRNVEVQVGKHFYGPLSYSVNQWMPTINFSKTWIDSVRHTMTQVLPSWSKQQMVVETNVQ